MGVQSKKALGEQLWLCHRPCWGTTVKKAGSVEKGDGYPADTLDGLILRNQEGTRSDCKSRIQGTLSQDLRYNAGCF